MKYVAAAVLVHGYSTAVRVLMLVLIPLSRCVAGLRRWELPARAAAPAVPRVPGPTVWLHAASLGECKLLFQFIAVLERKHPGQTYVVTAVTTTGLAYLRAHATRQVHVAGLFPLDTIGRMRSFLRRCRVRRVWIMETELWPAMLWACRVEKVPVGVVNARIEVGPFRTYRKLGWLFGSLVASFDIVYAQDETYARRYCELGLAAERVKVVGNLKAKVSIGPAPVEVRTAQRRALGIAPDELVLTVGCLHPGEGRIMQQLDERLTRHGRSHRIVVVPRHREAVTSIVEELGQHTLCLTEIRTECRDWRVCVIDRYGILDDMYGMADIAVVGGTFVPVGGHNMWDAARFGIPVLFGPSIHSQQQSCERLMRAGVGFMISDAREGAALVERLNGAGRKRFEASRDALAGELAHTHDRLVDWLPSAAEDISHRRPLGRKRERSSW